MNRNVLFSTFIILILLFSYAFPSVKVKIEGKTHTMDSYQEFNLTYVPITELNEFLKGEIFWNQLTKKGIWQLNSHQVVFSPFSPYIMVDTTVYNLVQEVRFKKGTLLACCEMFALST